MYFEFDIIIKNNKYIQVSEMNQIKKSVLLTLIPE